MNETVLMVIVYICMFAGIGCAIRSYLLSGDSWQTEMRRAALGLIGGLSLKLTAVALLFVPDNRGLALVFFVLGLGQVHQAVSAHRNARELAGTARQQQEQDAERERAALAAELDAADTLAAQLGLPPVPRMPAADRAEPS